MDKARNPWSSGLAFLLGAMGPVATVRLIYTLMLQQNDLTSGPGWLLFVFMSVGYWAWLPVAWVWVWGVNKLLPEAGPWNPAVGTFYSVALLIFFFHQPWTLALLLVGGSSFAWASILARRP